jgi:hypothetical protein
MVGLLNSRAAWQCSKTLSQQRQNQNEEGGLAGRVVHDREPASKHKVLSSNPTTAKKNGKGQTKVNVFFFVARCQWLLPIILATQEAEIRRLWFEVSLGK